jgi:hypothetical protein
MTDKKTSLSDEEKIRINANQRALQDVLRMHISEQIHLPDSLVHLGSGSDRLFRRLKKNVQESLGGPLTYALGIVTREYWFACFRSAIYMELSFSTQKLPLNDLQKKLQTAHGYAEYGGRAAALFHGLADITPPEERLYFLRNTPFSELIDSETILHCMGLYWFSIAEELAGEGKIAEAFEFVHEAYDALILANGLGMHKAGEEYAMETQTAHLRNLMAVTGANARHQKTRAIKAEAIRLYREQQWPSMRQAAKSIVPKIQAFCDNQNYPRLSSDRDLQTIYEWIRSASRT